MNKTEKIFKNSWDGKSGAVSPLVYNTLVCKQAHVRERHSQEQAPGAGRCGRNPHSRGRQRLVPSFPHGDGDENFWKATNSPQSHKAEDQSYLDGGGERQAGAAGEGEKGSAHQLKDFTLRGG